MRAGGVVQVRCCETKRTLGADEAEFVKRLFNSVHRLDAHLADAKSIAEVLDCPDSCRSLRRFGHREYCISLD